MKTEKVRGEDHYQCKHVKARLVTPFDCLLLNLKQPLSQQDAVGEVVEANDGALVAIASVKAGALKAGDKVYTAPPSTAQGVEEIARLTEALRKANEQAEHFEREWYLRGDKIEELEALPQGVEEWIKDNKFAAWDRDQEYTVVAVDDLRAFLSSLDDGMVRVPVELVEFLRGTGELEGLSFGEYHPASESGLNPKFWWRKYLPKASKGE